MTDAFVCLWVPCHLIGLPCPALKGKFIPHCMLLGYLLGACSFLKGNGGNDWGGSGEAE